MIFRFVGSKVALNSCDIDPHCEHKYQCSLFAHREAPMVNTSRWRWRLAAVDIMLTEDFNVEDRTRMNIVRITSLLNQLKGEKLKLQKLALRGLPTLEIRTQRSYLRFLLDQYKAEEDTQLKGRVFEQLAGAIVALVPGWYPGSNGNLRTEDNELDLVIFVEPSEERAKYWFKTFGAKIIVECKNHELLHSASSRTGGIIISPVRKLYKVLERTKAKLGLILNTGAISKELYKEAYRLSTDDASVVLINEEDLRVIIDSPGDAEKFFKEKVSNWILGARSKSTIE